MIRVNDKAMSYGEYCKVVKCQVKDNVLVNSVLSHIWEEESHGSNVKLTMFDIRHPEFIQSILHRTMSATRRLI